MTETAQIPEKVHVAIVLAEQGCDLKRQRSDIAVLAVTYQELLEGKSDLSDSALSKSEAKAALIEFYHSHAFQQLAVGEDALTLQHAALDL